MALKKYAPKILFLFSLIIPLLTSYPSIGWWDSGIHASHAYYLSVPGPGDSILYILIGKLFSIIFFFLTPIKAITLVSIFSTCLASVFFYFTMVRILNSFSDESKESVVIASSFVTALSLPFLYSIWIESYVTRTYTLGLLIASMIIFCTVKLWLSRDENEKRKLFFVIVFLLSIDYAAHRLNMPYIPFLLILLIFPLRKNLLSLKFWGWTVLLIAIGLSIHLYLLIRSPQHPLFYMDNIRNFKDLIAWINMDRFGEKNLSIIFDRRAPFWDYQVNFMYLRYFGWNFLGTNGSSFISGIIYLTAIPFVLGCIGFVYSLIKRIKIWTVIFVIFLLFSFGLVVYSNIREGFDQVREIDRLFIPSFMIFLFWVGIGMYFILVQFSRLLEKINLGSLLKNLKIVSLGLLILPVNIIVNNWNVCDKSKYYFPEDFAYNILSSCDKNAVLFTNGDNDTFPLWYLQSVEEYRPDITVANASLLNTDFFVQQLMESKNTFNIDPDILKNGLEPSKLDKPLEIVLPPADSKQKNPMDTLKATYTGRQFGKFSGLLPQDQVMMSFLEKNKWKRPVYFCVTVDPSSMLGLNDYLRSDGIVSKLVPYKNEKIDPEILGHNLMDVYRFRSFNNPDVRIERSIIRLYNNFRNLFYKLADYYLNSGNKKEAQKVFDAMQEKLPEWRFPVEQNKFINYLEKRLGE